MRLAGKLDDQHDAATLVDYLLTLGVTAKVERQGEGWDLWIFDEDQFARGREELAAFKAEPEADRYRNAGREAEKIRREKAEREIEARRNLVQTGPAVARRGSRPLTMVLLAGMSVVFVSSNFGQDRKFLRPLLFERTVVVDGVEQWSTVEHTLREEPWRLFTPMFIHYSIAHFVFNAMSLLSFGTLIETVRGTWRYAVLVLFLAAVSHLTQVWWNHRHQELAFFGGISGVIFGMFGYVWMKAWNDPWSGFSISNQSIMMMFVFHLLCVSGFLGNIANAAHIGGQIAGMAVGLMPTFGGPSRKKR